MKGFTVPEIDVEEYKAIDSYQADGPGQVSFEVGDIIHVLDKLEDGMLKQLFSMFDQAIKNN